MNIHASYCFTHLYRLTVNIGNMLTLLYFPAPAKPVLKSKPVSKTKTNLEIYWSVDYTGGYDIYQYTLRYRTTGTRSTRNERVLEVESALNRVINQQEGRWNLTGLERSIQYDVEVMAWNQIGSNTSDVFVYTTQKCGESFLLTEIVYTRPSYYYKLTVDMQSFCIQVYVNCTKEM